MAVVQKWEYVTHAVQVAPLTDLGQDGWRLVTVDDGIMFFERPFVEPPPKVAITAPDRTVKELTPDQVKEYNALTDDAAKNEYLMANGTDPKTPPVVVVEPPPPVVPTMRSQPAHA